MTSKNSLNTINVICVDLDGTLTPNDTLVEASLGLLCRNPLQFIRVLPILFQGRSQFKRAIAILEPINPKNLAWSRGFINWLQHEKKSGKRLVLVTAADEVYAQGVATFHHPLFDDFIGSDGIINLKSEAKAAKLVQMFGEKGFAYAGNSLADIPVWAHSGEAIVVNASCLIETAARSVAPVNHVFNGPHPSVKEWIKALRLHQWSKNGLLFIPMIGAHFYGDTQVWISCVLAFLAFGLCASSVYILNDLADLPSDRQHHRKSSRPFASGALPLLSGLAAIPILLVSALGVALFVGPFFVATLVSYYAMTLTYTVWLKKVPIVDVTLLAGLYMVRLIAGGAATGAAVSFWLLAFSIFIFLSLGLMKRYIELRELRRREINNTPGRGYQADDLEIIASMGVASGYISALVLAFYVRSEDVRAYYHHPEFLWGACLLVLFWISRAWLRAHRNLLHDDPVVFALRDNVSRLIALFCVILFILSTKT